MPNIGYLIASMPDIRRDEAIPDISAIVFLVCTHADPGCRSRMQIHWITHCNIKFVGFQVTLL